MIVSKYTQILKREDKVIWANTMSGKWIRMSKRANKIIESIIRSHCHIDLSEAVFEEREDYTFIKSLYQSLVEMGMLVFEKDPEFWQNRMAGIQLTNRCNLRCIHCCADAGEGDFKNELSTNEMLNVFDKVIAWNPRNIMISGGEPLLRKDFLELMQYLRKNFKGKISLSTNALLINEKNVAEIIKLFDSFDISIDGIDEKTCSIVRGAGVFDKVCEKIKLLKYKGAQSISLSMVFSDKNDSLMGEFDELNVKLGTIPMPRIFSPVGRGEINKNYFSDKDENDIYIPSSYLVEDYKEPFGICTCVAGRKEIIIAYDGSVYPCPSYWDKKYLLGNIKDSLSIEEIVGNAREGCMMCKSVEIDNPQNCSMCKDCSIRLFCWTCPGSIKDIKTEDAFRKRCAILKPILIDRIWNKNVSSV